MRYTLFVGNRIGYEALSLLINEANVEIIIVFIEEEHVHENEKYSERIKKICLDNSIPMSNMLTTDNIYNETVKAGPDVIMSFGYRRFISSKIYKLAKFCSVGSHFAPLPRYRGFAPVNWAIINGEKETAVSLFHLGEGIDDGDIIAQKHVYIKEEDDIQNVLERCIAQFKVMLSEEVTNFNNMEIKRMPQMHQEASYTCSRSPEDGYINWSKNTTEILNLIRASTYPFPGAYSYLKEDKIIIWKARSIELGSYVGRIPGRVVKIINDVGVCVLTGDGAILITDVQFEDNERISADSVIKSIRIKLH
ncbi:methionyl-tRNA formyltransferase [Peribacillus butanolivorans]|uniref:methionyl-tRNA formyltransferase n=1 Tax=Peribacillus butanolivorans TaxID=421767 RepID=UPI003D281EE9